MSKTKRLILEKVWFPHIDRLVEMTVKSCLATSPEHSSEPLRMTELPAHPWPEVSIDFAGPFSSGEYLLVVIDSYSRSLEIDILTSTSEKAVIPRLDEIFAHNGVAPFNSANFA